MRENMGLYRGKVPNGTRWVFGPLLFVDGEPAIYDTSDHESSAIWQYGEAHLWGAVPVIPETVGQFTGLYDSTKWEDLTPEEQETFLHQPDGWESTPDEWPGKRIFEGDILEWDAREWGSEFREVAEWNYSLLAARKHDWHEWCKVIGNIHDDKELLHED